MMLHAGRAGLEAEAGEPGVAVLLLCQRSAISITLYIAWLPGLLGQTAQPNFSGSKPARHAQWSKQVNGSHGFLPTPSHYSIPPLLMACLACCCICLQLCIINNVWHISFGSAIDVMLPYSHAADQ